MKIVFLINSLEMGGAEKHTLQLAAGLVALGVDVTIDTLRSDGRHYSVPDHRILMRSSGGNGLFAVGAILSLAAFLRTAKPDIVVGVTERPLYFAFLGRALARTPCILATIRHSTGFAHWRERVLMPLNLILVRACDLSIYVSALQEQWWRRRGFRSRRVTVIHNGVDSRHFAVPAAMPRLAKRRALGIADEQIVIGLCAALRPEKNPFHLVDAIAALNAEDDRYHALIVGDGHLSQPLRAYIHRRGMDNRITLAGAQKDVRPWIAMFDIGVLCSTSIETFSLAALEIMAMGRPMVLSEVGGAAEMVRPGINGMLFPKGDTAALVCAIKALRDPVERTRMGEVARLIVETEFTPQQMIKRYVDIFADVSSGRATAIR